MNLNLKDKVIVVSGGAKGIGRAIVEVLAEEGACPIILGRNGKDNQKVVDLLQEKGQKADSFVAELTHPEECKTAIDFVIDKYQKIDGLVNNAGLNDGVGLENGSYEDFVDSLHKNVVHYYLLAHLSLPKLKMSRGAIVNIGSKVSLTGQGGTSGYAASNGGRNALTREWAVELLPYQIRVNAIIVAEASTPQYKNWVKNFEDPEAKLKSITDNIPLGHRMTKPEEIAYTAAFLLSDRSGHTTGQLVHVDGGYVHLDRAL